MKTATNRSTAAIDPATEDFAERAAPRPRCQAEIDSLQYFYDDVGARLFDEICNLPEYYPARTEISLLRAHAAEIAVLAGPGIEIMEFGAGCGEKIRILLDFLDHPLAYVPIDISEAWLGTAVERLARSYPELAIHPLIADFAAPLSWPIRSQARRIGFFPGSTIGNFTPGEARKFLLGLSGVLRNGALLIGVDLVKDPAKLHAAYNDSAGITAEFNRNVLARANRELDANFDVSAFAHYAFYNAQESRVEMHLVSRKRQSVVVSSDTIAFAEGESAMTEYSCKYTVDGFQKLAATSGFTPRHVWCDPERLFSVHWLEVA